MKIARGESGSLLGALRVALIVLGLLMILPALVVLVLIVVQFSSRTAPFAGPEVLLFSIYPVIVLACGALCLSAAAMLKLLVRRVEQGEAQQRLLEQLRIPLTLAAPPAPSTATPAPLPQAHASHSEEKHGDPARAQMLELLQQIRDASMMSEAQREQCAARHWAKRKEAISKLVERYMLSGDWAMAKSRLEELQSLLPADMEVQSLGERLAAEHSSRLTEDLKAARAQLHHLMSITAWQEAEEIVKSLEHKYPHDAQVHELAGDMANEREKLERENRERLLSELADATDRKQWRRAITTAEEFIGRYPADTFAERLQFDLQTLRDNAAAQERKEQETLFKDLLKRQRYEEAEGVARGLIDKYPGSPAAAELMKMLPRVEELHRQEKLRRQAVGATG